ncbi:UDP-N-acetylmuramate dehydrogenase [Flavobacteriaceae bacterium MAR_2010_72]|nr:UDP-N-acetylmuramate dehydrogenase [Flavobacteriaceae bacterium MAR_2010_72]TVZ57712.1 UDP-N-acetylmuramate dehydrogenase [Flavobacteriaceae bacterium MAR_2010_105]
MHIQQNISLKSYNTFGIDVKAKHFVSAKSLQDLQEVLSSSAYPNKFILGGGSNMLLTKDIDALVILIDLKGIEVVSQSREHVIVKAYAGENWHEFVLWCLKNNFGGIENLSLIPGNVGSAPIQNIGAYGVELKDVFVSCEAIDLKNRSIRTFNKADCEFDYRESIFKQKLKDTLIITSVTLKLTSSNHKLSTGYGAIANQLQEYNIAQPTIQDISKAVIAIRQSKLPDPKDIGNSGSFFKNPVISKTQFEVLKAQFPTIPSYEVSSTEIKVPAGWLIEQAGFKGKTLGNYGVHKDQALVLVNYGGATGQDILQLARLIQKTVFKIFNISIETEVNII